MKADPPKERKSNFEGYLGRNKTEWDAQVLWLIGTNKTKQTNKANREKMQALTFCLWST